jgi:hypothetical protein
LIDSFKNNVNEFDYLEINRIIIDSNINGNINNGNTSQTAINIENNVTSNIKGENQQIDNKIIDPSMMLHIRKKLFAKSGYPMFSFNVKRRITEYGQVNILILTIDVVRKRVSAN